MQSWKGKTNEEGAKVSKRKKDGRGYRPKEKPQHLYLVLDDWSLGYSIRKIELSSADPGEQLTHRMRLPSASFKFAAPRGCPRYFAGAYDSKILAMQPIGSKIENISMDAFLIYDVHMRSIIAGPRQSPDPIDPIYIPVGDRLFALAAGSFQLLCLPPYYECARKDFVWTWHNLPKPPFLHEHVTCYAVHGDGRIYVTVDGGTPATFSFDTADSVMKGEARWKNHAQWNMPFTGRAYFVPELNALVGLYGCTSFIGALALDVVSEDVDGTQPKLCEDLFSLLLRDVSAIGSTLVSMGGGSEFCLLQYIYKIEDELTGSSTSKESNIYKIEDELTGSSTSKESKELQDCKPVMRLITFSLKYDNNGGLKTSSCQIQHYSVPSEVTLSMLETPVAFWM